MTDAPAPYAQKDNGPPATTLHAHAKRKCGETHTSGVQPSAQRLPHAQSLEPTRRNHMTDQRELSRPSWEKPRRSAAERAIAKEMERADNRSKLMKAMDKEVRHIRNAAEHRGHKEALLYAQELTGFVAAAMAITRPYDEQGQLRPEGNVEEFWEWLKHMKDLLGLRLPYERPRLASISIRPEASDEDREEYETVIELRARMVKKGLPVDHLADRPMVLEHELSHDPPKSNGGANGHGR